MLSGNSGHPPSGKTLSCVSRHRPLGKTLGFGGEDPEKGQENYLGSPNRMPARRQRRRLEPLAWQSSGKTLTVAPHPGQRLRVFTGQKQGFP